MMSIYVSISDLIFIFHTEIGKFYLKEDKVNHMYVKLAIYTQMTQTGMIICHVKKTYECSYHRDEPYIGFLFTANHLFTNLRSKFSLPLPNWSSTMLLNPTSTFSVDSYMLSTNCLLLWHSNAIDQISCCYWDQMLSTNHIAPFSHVTSVVNQ